MSTHSKKAEIRTLGGTPTLFVAGEPHPGLAYMTFDPDRGCYADFARAGIDLVSFSTTGDFHLYGLAEPTWLAPGVYDYSPLDRRVARILSQHPKAWLLPRVFVGSPPWWDEANPGELIRYADGSTRKPLHEDARKMTVASFSSTAWRRDAGEALARLVRYLRHCDYADRIVGIHLASAETEEWFYCGTYQGFFSDYSEPHRRAFVDWLRARYGDETRLAEAWGRAVRFDEVVVPTEEKRRARECFSLRDPRAARDVIDYTIFRGEDVASAIAHFARIVKAESAGELLCGTFYGYLMELSLHPNGLHLGGHGGLGALLRSPDVDFLSSPTSYFNRQARGGETHFMSISDSIRLHGKLWFNENDVRTHLLPGNAGYGRTTTLEETITVQRREFAHSLSRGAGMWWFDMTGGWYAEPAVMAEIERLGAIARESLVAAASPAALAAQLARCAVRSLSHRGSAARAAVPRLPVPEPARDRGTLARFRSR
ncbi:MAG: beta-galactosidase [Planctomycetes bacterium]|nr:beta-galactosidase [Planctomycetota bacterium]